MTPRGPNLRTDIARQVADMLGGPGWGSLRLRPEAAGLLGELPPLARYWWQIGSGNIDVRLVAETVPYAGGLDLALEINHSREWFAQLRDPEWSRGRPA